MGGAHHSTQARRQSHNDPDQHNRHKSEHEHRDKKRASRKASRSKKRASPQQATPPTTNHTMLNNTDPLRNHNDQVNTMPQAIARRTTTPIIDWAHSTMGQLMPTERDMLSDFLNDIAIPGREARAIAPHYGLTPDEWPAIHNYVQHATAPEKEDMKRHTKWVCKMLNKRTPNTELTDLGLLITAFALTSPNTDMNVNIIWTRGTQLVRDLRSNAINETIYNKQQPPRQPTSTRGATRKPRNQRRGKRNTTSTTPNPQREATTNQSNQPSMDDTNYDDQLHTDTEGGAYPIWAETETPSKPEAAERETSPPGGPELPTSPATPDEHADEGPPIMQGPSVQHHVTIFGRSRTNNGRSINLG
jgi:hypothetical protein